MYNNKIQDLMCVSDLNFCTHRTLTTKLYKIYTQKYNYLLLQAAVKRDLMLSLPHISTRLILKKSWRTFLARAKQKHRRRKHHLPQQEASPNPHPHRYASSILTRSLSKHLRMLRGNRIADSERDRSLNTESTSPPHQSPDEGLTTAIMDMEKLKRMQASARVGELLLFRRFQEFWELRGWETPISGQV